MNSIDSSRKEFEFESISNYYPIINGVIINRMAQSGKIIDRTGAVIGYLDHFENGEIFKPEEYSGIPLYLYLNYLNDEHAHYRSVLYSYLGSIERKKTISQVKEQYESTCDI
jgi:hypothetical protein